MTERERWEAYVCAALSGTADPRLLPGDIFDPDKDVRWKANHAARIADAALAESVKRSAERRVLGLDSGEPEPGYTLSDVERLVIEARRACKAVPSNALFNALRPFERLVRDP